ncbi:hypothetical protein Zmor_016329 [Zophobas morio]|uniref:Cyclic nucleotide-binding domain-containing protein n=1 Tax=Zophobas morio TaxID=2755281 RepID=A0AA38HEA7_9CUCU|nr:hypothetical protein Zmor_016329 [Zophobas morio]
MSVQVGGRLFNYKFFRGGGTSAFRTDEETRLLELRNGDFFGEMALFSDSPRPFKCAAKSDVVCLKLLRKNFQAFLQVSPSISENVEQIIRKRTGDFLLRIPFFSHIKENKPWSKLSLLGNLCQFEFFPSGSTVFREGQPGDKFYVIVTGQVKASVFVDGSDHILSELGPGDFFGEVALTCDTTRQTEHDVSDGTPFGDPFMLSTVHAVFTLNFFKEEVEAAKGRKVIAKSEALVISLTRGQLEKFFKIAPELKQEILSTFRK